MKVIDLLNKIANDDEFRPNIKYRKITYTYKKEFNDYQNDNNDDWGILNDFCINMILNDEIEIIEEETTYEQNFTGWKMFQSGKVVCSYDCDRPALKPVDIADVEKDVKEMLKENPKKIEELDIDKMLQTKKWKRDKNAWKKINELTKAVNYLLEKESDK